MPVRSRREKLLDAARAACADWEPELAGQITVFDAIADAEEEEVTLEKDPE